MVTEEMIQVAVAACVRQEETHTRLRKQQPNGCARLPEWEEIDREVRNACERIVTAFGPLVQYHWLDDRGTYREVLGKSRGREEGEDVTRRSDADQWVRVYVASNHNNGTQRWARRDAMPDWFAHLLEQVDVKGVSGGLTREWEHVYWACRWVAGLPVWPWTSSYTHVPDPVLPDPMPEEALA